MYYLKNEELTVEIASLGAEMKSLKDNRTRAGVSVGRRSGLSGKRAYPRCIFPAGWKLP